jgi:hypothetical protein
MKLTPRYNWNIVESGIKHHKPNLYFLHDQVWTLCMVMFQINIDETKLEWKSYLVTFYIYDKDVIF